MSVTGGKATKRTRLGKITASIARGTLRSAEFCITSGLKYHVIDAEWKMNYLHDDEVTDLLEISDRSITTILTYSTPFVLREKHPASMDGRVRLREIWRMPCCRKRCVLGRG